MNPSKLLFVCVPFLFAVACGGSQGAPEAPAAPPAEPTPAPAATETAPPPAASEVPPAEPAPAPAPGAAAKPFDQMSHDEQIAFMKDVVVPTMKPLFQAHDAKAFAEFGCVSCHGPGAKQGKFDMPTSALPKLDPKDGFAVHKKKTPEMMTFMMEKVLPEMAKTLNEPLYDPATQKGFGCVGCHELKK
jgi:mono/diheme cytochrome c family protein